MKHVAFVAEFAWLAGAVCLLGVETPKQAAGFAMVLAWGAFVRLQRRPRVGP